MFPRVAIHIGDNNNWKGSIVIQHDEKTATMLSQGPEMEAETRNKYPHLSTFECKCTASHWKAYSSVDRNEQNPYEYFGGFVLNGKVYFPQ